MNELEKTQDALMQIICIAGDLIHAINSNPKYVFDKDFPHTLLSQLGEAGRKARAFLPPHHLWDLTNNPKLAESIKNALGYYEENND